MKKAARRRLLYSLMKRIDESIYFEAAAAAASTAAEAAPATAEAASAAAATVPAAAEAAASTAAEAAATGAGAAAGAGAAGASSFLPQAARATAAITAAIRSDLFMLIPQSKSLTSYRQWRASPTRPTWPTVIKRLHGQEKFSQFHTQPLIIHNETNLASYRCVAATAGTPSQYHAPCQGWIQPSSHHCASSSASASLARATVAASRLRASARRRSISASSSAACQESPFMKTCRSS